MDQTRHLEALLQLGAEAWNAWRMANPDVEIDLAGFELVDAGSLSECDLRDANLQRSRLQFCMLRYTNFEQANLQFADFRSSGLRDVNLKNARLEGINLGNADLRNADLRNARMQFSILHAADFRRSKLNGVNFDGADLRSADLRDTDLAGVSLRNANLVDARLPPSIASADVAASLIDWRTTARLIHIEGLPELLQRTGMPVPVARSMVTALKALEPGMISVMLQSVFLAYAPGDSRLALRVRASLEAKGVVGWYCAQDDPHRTLQLHQPRFERMLLICTRAMLSDPDVIFDLNALMEEDFEVGGGNIVVPIIAEAGLFETAGPPEWWPGTRTSTLAYDQIRQRASVDVTNARDDDLRLHDELSKVVVELQKPVDVAAKRAAVTKHFAEVRQRRNPARPRLN